MSIAASLAILLATGIALLTADPRYAGVVLVMGFAILLTV